MFKLVPDGYILEGQVGNKRIPLAYLGPITNAVNSIHLGIFALFWLSHKVKQKKLTNIFDLCPAPTVYQASWWTWWEVQWWIRQRPLIQVEMRGRGHWSGGKTRPLKVHPFSIPTKLSLHLWCYLFVGGRGTGEGTFWNFYTRDSVALKSSPTYIFVSIGLILVLN